MRRGWSAGRIRSCLLYTSGATARDASAAETRELRKLLGDLSGELRRAESVRDALTAVDTAERKVESLEARTARDLSLIHI